MKKSTVRILARLARPVCIARTSTNAGHVLSVCVAAHSEVLTLTAMRDGSTVRALSIAFDGRKRVTNESVSAIAARLVNVLETFDSDTVETFNDSLIGGWEFDYSAYIGEALDRLADARILSR